MIIGIDPSLCATGIVVIDKSNKNELLEYKTIKTDSADSMRNRVSAIHAGVFIVCRDYHRHLRSCVLEIPLQYSEFGAVKQHIAFGVCLLTVELSMQVWSSTADINFVSPTVWRKDLGIAGNSTKKQVQAHLQSLGYTLNTEHEYDALGIALAKRTQDDI